MQPVDSVTSVIPNPPPVMKDVTHLSPADKQRLWQAAKDLESTFSTYLLHEVKFGEVQKDGKQSFASDTYGDMFKHSLADQLARSGTMGLAKQIYMDSARLAEKTMVASTIHPPTDKLPASLAPVQSSVPSALTSPAKLTKQPSNPA